MFTFLLLLGLVVCFLGMRHELRIKRGVKANYWRVLCHLKQWPTGSNVMAIVHVLGIDSEVAYQTLERLYNEGYSDFTADSDNHAYERQYYITDGGRAVIEQYKWQLHSYGLYTD